MVALKDVGCTSIVVVRMDFDHCDWVEGYIWLVDDKMFSRFGGGVQKHG